MINDIKQEHELLVNKGPVDDIALKEEIPEKLLHLKEINDSFFRAVLVVFLAVLLVAAMTLFGRLYSIFIPFTVVSHDVGNFILTCNPNTVPVLSFASGSECTTQISGNTCMFDCSDSEENSFLWFKGIYCVCKYSATT